MNEAISVNIRYETNGWFPLAIEAEAELEEKKPSDLSDSDSVKRPIPIAIPFVIYTRV